MWQICFTHGVFVLGKEYQIVSYANLRLANSLPIEKAKEEKEF